MTKTLKFRFTGLREILMHNERLANPFNEHTQKLAALTRKRNKTIDDLSDIAYVEFVGGLYCDDNGPYIPDLMVEACFRESARKEKLGKKFDIGIEVISGNIPLMYGDKKSPRDPDKLWKAGYYDQRMVKLNGKTKTLRTRPKFPAGWTIEFALVYDPNVLDETQVIRVAQRGGEQICLGDYRPRFGRFKVEKL